MCLFIDLETNQVMPGIDDMLSQLAAFDTFTMAQKCGPLEKGAAIVTVNTEVTPEGSECETTYKGVRSGGWALTTQHQHEAAWSI